MYILTIVFLTSHTTHIIHIFTCPTTTIKMTTCSNNLQLAKTSYHSSLISNPISKLTIPTQLLVTSDGPNALLQIPIHLLHITKTSNNANIPIGPDHHQCALC